MTYAAVTREINGFCFRGSIGNPGVQYLFRRLVTEVFRMYADFHKPFQQRNRFFDSLSFCFFDLGMGLGHLFLKDVITV